MTKTKNTPRAPTWTEKDNQKAAEKQGWAIFECSGSSYAPKEGPDLRIQADSDIGAFRVDEDVWRFVVHTAEHGNKLAARALRYLRVAQPAHYEEVMTKRLGCLTPEPTPKADDCARNPCDICKKRAEAAAEESCYDCEKGYEHERWADFCNAPE